MFTKNKKCYNIKLIRGDTNNTIILYKEKSKTNEK